MNGSEGFDDGSLGWQEVPSGGGERARRVRAQAELAWARVQRVVRRQEGPEFLPAGLREPMARVPREGYLAGFAWTLATSTWLYLAGRRTAGLSLAFWGSSILGLGLYVRSARRAETRGQEQIAARR